MSANMQEAGFPPPGLSLELSQSFRAIPDSSSAVRPMYNNPKLVAAIEYAALGFRILPVSSGDKSIPKVDDWRERATSDMAQLIEWWTTWPDANIGVLTGSASGLLAIDLDVKNDPQGVGGYLSLLAFELARPEIDWSGAVRAVTPSGGMHIYFRETAALPSMLGWLPDVDFLADKRFVVVPPSTRVVASAERSYRFVTGDFTQLQPTPPGLVAAAGARDGLLATARAIPRAIQQVVDSAGYGRHLDQATDHYREAGFRLGERDNGFYDLSCRLWRQHPDEPGLIEDILRDVWEATDQGSDPFPWAMVEQKMNGARAFVEASRKAELTDDLHGIRYLLGVLHGNR